MRTQSKSPEAVKNTISQSAESLRKLRSFSKVENYEIGIEAKRVGEKRV